MGSVTPADARGPALIEAEQARARRLLFDDEDDILQPPAKARGHDGHAFVHQLVEIARIHGIALL